MAKTYTTTQDYIEQNITPGLGDVELTPAQALHVAQCMTLPSPDGNGLIENPAVNFWYMVEEALETK